MSWKITPLSAFLTEREGRIKHTEANDLGLRRVTKIDFSGQIHLDQSTDTKTDMIRVRPGDLLISGINAAKGAISVHEDEEDVLATIHYSAYRYDPEQISVDFLKWFFKSPEFIDLLKQQVSGGIKTELKSKHILPLRLRLPKLREQASIATRLNSIQLEQVKLEQEIAHQEDLVAKLKQAILQEAITGRLTAGWRAAQTDVEPASQLLARIRAEKARLVAAKKLRPEKPLPPIPASEIPFTIPEGWEWCRLGSLGYTQTGTTPDTTEPANFGTHISFVKPADIDEHGITYDQECLSERGLNEGRSIEAGSILMVCIGSSTGKVAATDRPVSCNQQINTLTPLADTPVRCVEYVLKSPYFQEALWAATKTGITPIINKGKWSAIPLPLPPLREQTEFVARVEGLMERCRELEAEIERSRAHAAALLQAVLREAFAPAASDAA